MMKKILISLTLMALFGLFSSSFASAQGMMDMMGVSNSSEQTDGGHTAREEVEGEEIWNKLQEKQVSCEDLSDGDFASLGEYFMGQMMGEAHEAMNNRLIQMLGEEGEEQMHVVMGKRMSGCEPDAAFPQNMMGGGMMPMMMNMMMGGGGNPVMGGFGSNPMGIFGWGFSWVFMILFWGLIILGIVALVKWLIGQNRGETKDKSALDILKQRYAKGEIDKKEYEEKLKVLTKE